MDNLWIANARQAKRLDRERAALGFKKLEAPHVVGKAKSLFADSDEEERVIK